MNIQVKQIHIAYVFDDDTAASTTLPLAAFNSVLHNFSTRNAGLLCREVVSRQIF